MPKLEVVTDGTTKGFQLIIDGEDITKAMHVTSFSMEAAAGDEYIHYGYSTSEDYVNEEGKKQGQISKHFSYRNGGWMPEETAKLGEEASDARIGGKQLVDITIEDKLQRMSKRREHGTEHKT